MNPDCFDDQPRSLDSIKKHRSLRLCYAHGRFAHSMLCSLDTVLVHAIHAPLLVIGSSAT